MDINSPLPSLISSLYQNNASLSESQASEDATNAYIPSTRDDSKVTLSLRSQKLSAISKEFFNGPIASENIAALTQSLYENGFLNGTDLQSLGGQYTEQNNITKAKHTLSSFTLEASKHGDENTVSILNTITSALDNMDQPSTQQLRQTEIIALDFAQQFLANLQQIPADEALIKDFENVVDVLSTLDTLRQNDQLEDGSQTYQSIEEQFNQLFEGDSP
ncbi:MAG: hypothetical protein HWE18_08845 [Gammaproteobacteria bacterium]|nr:hypothetical protein [Gammaproteobacteria bacterium]